MMYRWQTIAQLHKSINAVYNRYAFAAVYGTPRLTQRTSASLSELLTGRLPEDSMGCSDAKEIARSRSQVPVRYRGRGRG
jgi:hypothetical protein